MTIDPVEKFRWWTTATFVAVLAAAWVPIFVWEMVWRLGADYGVDSALTAALGPIMGGAYLATRSKGP